MAITTTESAFLRNRVNMPTQLGSAELAQLPAQIRARSFFSARVAEAHILEKFRQVSDDYSAGRSAATRPGRSCASSPVKTAGTTEARD